MAEDGSKAWCLYLLECRNGAFYAGITNDLNKRYAAHAAGKGAKYTRSNPPVRILAVAPFEDRAAASRAEWEIKQAPKEKKLSVIQAFIVATEAQGTPCQSRPKP